MPYTCGTKCLKDGWRRSLRKISRRWIIRWVRLLVRYITEVTSWLIKWAYTSAVPLTHLSLVPNICVGVLDQHWFRQWLVAYSAPSHYLNQCWVIVNLNLRNKLQWNFIQHTKLFIHKKASENIVCEMAAILFRGRWNHAPGLFSVHGWIKSRPMKEDLTCVKC